MNIGKALLIPGWMSEAELTWLANAASASEKIAEIGCWQGRSTRALADNTSGTVFAIDIWTNTFSCTGPAENEDKPDNWVFTAFTEHMKDLTNLVIVHMNSKKASELFSAHKFDMIFIDAAHDYDSVKLDIISWLPLMKNGGIICGHDGDFVGVSKATSEIFGTVSNPAGSIWTYKV